MHGNTISRRYRSTNHAETTRIGDHLKFHIVEAALLGHLDETAQMNGIDKLLTVRSLTGHEMILRTLEPYPGALYGNKWEKSVDVKQPIKVDLNTLKSKGEKGVPQAPLGTATG